MKKSLLIALTLLLGQFAFSQMNTSYSIYMPNPTSDNTYIYVSGVVDGTSTCISNIEHFDCGSIYHQGQVQLTVGSNTGTTYGPHVCPKCYINQTGTESSTYQPGVIAQAKALGLVFCSGIGGIIWEGLPQIAQVEVAVTDVAWPGTPACVVQQDGSCIYKVNWHCDAAHTPPDYPVGSIKSGKVAGASYIVWRAISPCIRFHWPGPWGCYAGAFPVNSFMLSVNDPGYPLYACTHNP